MTHGILIIGSSNTDMVIKTDHLPVPGETILGGTFFMTPGGKGANQAVAAARLGGTVTLICKVGKDMFGNEAKALFKQEGINISHLLTDATLPSGIALIIVDKKAENCIAVASGANAALMWDDLQNIDALMEAATLILIQLEIPLATVHYIVTKAFSKGIPVMLNPAPACALSDELLQCISIITPNETEAEILTGIKVTDVTSAQQAANMLYSKGIPTVIITMGSNGALVLHDGIFHHVPAIAVQAVDTTAAGDVFNGALAVALSHGKAVHEAAAFACKAASISVTRLGAQASAPYIHEVENL
ncbi:ribokinase [Ilyomonas limi]|uniref:Ribokinase n=1 Tax=Ilyomonas limi TaxID=2575867 RepID=A0A4V5UTL4_9BACT|nr:ribokinase [Ilyomonas limi]TKK65513.1 ribokinase [Ilyomonas limi]